MAGIKRDPHEHYFVAFGRDRGGLLDVLGLPPGAAPAQVSTRIEEYRKRIENEMRADRAQHRKRKDDGEITPEEFNRIADELLQQADARLAELKDLKEPYDALIAERRRLLRQGTTVREEILWQRMYPDIDDVDGLLQLLDGLHLTPLHCLSVAEVDERLTAWLSPEKLLVTDTEGSSPGLAWAALGLVSEETRDSDEIHDLFELVAENFQTEIATSANGHNGPEVVRSNHHESEQSAKWIESERQLLCSLLERIGAVPARLFEELGISPDMPESEIRNALDIRRAEVKREIEEIVAERAEQFHCGELALEAFEQFKQECGAVGAAWEAHFDGLLAGWECQQQLHQSMRDRVGPHLALAVHRLIADQQTAYSVLAGKSVISRLVELVRESRLQVLLTADALWSALAGTNRIYWQRELEQFLASLHANKIDGKIADANQPGRFSHRHQAFVSQLPWGEIEETSGPMRGATSGREESPFRDLLARLGGFELAGGEDEGASAAQFRAQLEELLGRRIEELPPPGGS